MSQISDLTTSGMGLGMAPTLVDGVSTGGAYMLRDPCGTVVAMLKPRDEEAYAPNNPKRHAGAAVGGPGIKRGEWVRHVWMEHLCLQHVAV